MKSVLYKLDTKWKIRVHYVYTKWDLLYQKYWLLNWKLIEIHKQCKGKNIWKTNETTSGDQAYKELLSLVNKKKSEWYVKNIEDVKENIKPMLAKTYKSNIELEWDIFIQPKLDWVRCLAFINWDSIKLISRSWYKFETLQHIENQLLNKYKWEKIILDWELYAHWYTFQENISMVKKYTEWYTEKLEYCIYDCISDKPYKDRQEYNTVKTIQITKTYIDKYHGSFINQWYEWSIIRHWSGWYELWKRSKYLLKKKDFIDKTYTVIDVVPSEARPEQWVLVLDWFKSNLKMSHKEREDILKHKDEYIWQTAEIRFFEYTDWGIPRFPVCVWFRIDK